MLRKQTNFPPPLTPREKEVADLISQGETNQEIMEKLSISKHTLKVHIGSLYRKYGITSIDTKELSVKRLRFALKYLSVKKTIWYNDTVIPNTLQIKYLKRKKDY